MNWQIRRAVDVTVDVPIAMCTTDDGPIDWCGCYEVRAWPIGSPSFDRHDYGFVRETLIDTMVRMSRYHPEHFSQYCVFEIVDRRTKTTVWRDTYMGLLARQ